MNYKHLDVHLERSVKPSLGSPSLHDKIMMMCGNVDLESKVHLVLTEF